ncbi:phospholipid phosphatase-related protein type 1-like [Amblyomma americanum]
MYSSQGNNTASSSLDDSLKAIKDCELPADGCAAAATDGEEEEGEDTSASSVGRVYRINLSLLPVALTELVALMALALVAYALRTGSAPVPLTERLFRCDDPDLSWPQSPLAAVAEDSLALALLGAGTLYGACAALPLAVIVLGELGQAAFSRRSRKVVRAGCVGCKMHQLTRRMLRHTGLYLLGALCTSVAVDLLKRAVGAQRPYFLSVCQLNRTCEPAHRETRYYRSHFCRAAHEPEDVADLRDASMSFPSFHAALITYAAVYVMVYLHSVVRLRSSRLLKPAVCVSLGLLSLFVCASRVTLRRNHAADVLAGAAMGAAVAAYVCLCSAHQFRERRCSKGPGAASAVAGARPHSQPGSGPLLYRYLHIPHVAYRDRSGRDAFQRDLHKRIVEDRRKQQHNDAGPGRNAAAQQADG